MKTSDGSVPFGEHKWILDKPLMFKAIEFYDQMNDLLVFSSSDTTTCTTMGEK